MKLLTKVASGVAYGDVSNQGIRNILTEISKKMGGKFTEQEMQDTLDHFGWKCPYTGRDLRNSIMTNDGSYATDHIYPQNKEWCGLNVKGNLVIVDRKANSKKRDMDIKTFMLTDTEFLGNLDMETRKNRLKKIEDFQKECGYDPEQIRTQISPILKARYDEIRSEQENFIDTALGILSTASIYKAPTPIAPTSSAPSSKSNVKKPKLSTELIFQPTDEKLFKEELLKSKKAHFVLTYDTGIVKTTNWNAEDFLPTSNLRGNILSKTFWRNRSKEGLIKVEAFID